MNSLAADPARFKPYRESLLATIIRTGAIALVGGSVACFIQLRHLPTTSAQWHSWLALVVFVAWISFGGHWVELAYLNGIRPRISRWSDLSLILVRLCVWTAGGVILFLGAVISQSLLMTAAAPPKSQIVAALLLGGPAFAAVEFVAHAFLWRAGKPSFWNRRG